MTKQDATIQVICKYFDMPIGLYELNLHKRNRRFVVIRQWGMFFIKRYTKMSLSDVASIFKKDHATCLTSVRTIEDQLTYDKRYQHHFNDLDAKISEIYKKEDHETYDTPIYNRLLTNQSLIVYQTRARLYHSIK